MSPAADGRLWRLEVSPRTGKPTAPPEQIANLGLASIRQLAISADGRDIAYATMSTTSNLWALDIDPETALPRGGPAPLIAGTGRNNRPAFSPDGNRIAFDRWRLGGSIDVWTMGAGGGDEVQVTAGDEDRSQPSWYPDGERLTYHAGSGADRGLWTADLVRREERRLRRLDEDVHWAKLSPDATRVAYHARVAGGGDSVWVLDLAGDERRQLTPAGLSMAFPVWSPDGEWLAFQKREGGDSQVMVVPAGGGEAVQLTRAAGQNWPYSFSPDGDKVAFAALRDEDWNLWWVSRSTGAERRLGDSLELNQYVRYPAWSPDGDRIVYELAQTTGDVFLVRDRPSP